jgi:hypothetical protein
MPLPGEIFLLLSSGVFLVTVRCIIWLGNHYFEWLFPLTLFSRSKELVYPEHEKHP